jgi:hypothetical protein
VVNARRFSVGCGSQPLPFGRTIQFIPNGSGFLAPAQAAFIALTIVWTLFFVVWYLLGIPFGLGR